MLLDAFKLHSVIVQVTYPDAFELWDCAGAIARGASRIWPNLVLEDGKPNEQTMRNDSVALTTGVRVSTIQAISGKGFDQTTTDCIAETFKLWATHLGITTLSRVSCRSKYVKDFPTKAAADAEVISLGMCPIPKERVFNLPEDCQIRPAIEVVWRFDDPTTFTHLRVGSEEIAVEIKAHPEFPDAYVKKTRSRAYIDFDRGVLGEVKLSDFRIAEWLKGYQHVLRRDIEKVIPPVGKTK
jgi:hypothetical protein